jgi:hypothetical protein
MIAAQRGVHRRVWTVLAVVLVVLIAAALLARRGVPMAETLPGVQAGTGGGGAR